MSVTEFPKGKNNLPDELKDLPPELLAQLSTSFKKGKQSQSEDDLLAKLKEIFSEHDHPLTLDEIILQYYRKHQKVLKRNSLSAQLQRLKGKGAIVRPNNRVYAIPESPL